MTEPTPAIKIKPLAKAKNINGEQITLNRHKLGFFSVDKENETLLRTKRLKDAEVFFINCF